MSTFSFFIVTVLMVVSVTAYDDNDIEDNIMWRVLRHDTIFDEPKGVVKFGEDMLSFICIFTHPLTDVFRPFEKTINARMVTIEECTLPVTPLSEVLQALNVNVTAIEILRLSMYYSTKALPEGNYTTGLSIKSLWISAPLMRYENILLKNPDFMKPLKNLTRLIVWGTEIPTITDTTHLKVLSLGFRAIVKTWLPFCEHLEELSISDLLAMDVPDVWPEECSQLTSLKLIQKVSLAVNKFINSGVHKGCENLQRLDMPSCKQTDPPHQILNAAKYLLHLNMSDNKLEDKSLLNFPLMRNLTHLDLSQNQLTGWVIFDLVKQLPSLQYLKLDSNRFVNLFCNYQTKLNDFASHLTSLESISLRKMPMDVNCLQTVIFPKLKYLDLASDKFVKIFDFQHLPQTNATQLQVDLRGRPIKYINFERDHYNLLQKENLTAFWGTKKGHNATKVTVWLSYIDCDCKNYWLAKALHEKPDLLALPGLKCRNSGRYILDEPLDNMNCGKNKRERGCYIRTQQYTNGEGKKTAIVDCHGGTNSYNTDLYPEYNSDVLRTIGLNVSNDHITSLKYIKLNDWLEWIDLRHNKITRLDANDTSRLFAVPERRVWLSGNLLICDCNNQQLLDALYEHRKQVVDFDDIICINSRKRLSSMTSRNVCQGSYIALAVISILLLLVAGFMWYHRQRLKIFLYSRGLCLSCLRRDDDEPDKPYDAFLLFAHEDMVYARDQLLPKLEGKPNSFRVCVNYRNWSVGEWLPAATERSVNLSKRTILLLSKNLLRSIDSSPEFRLVVMGALHQSPERVLVVLLDDAVSEPLYADLRAHLPRTHLSCDESCFWDKLRYAMPHKRRRNDTNVVSSSPIEDNSMVTKI